MWKQDESKDAHASENGVQPESWWSKDSSCSIGATTGEQMESLFAEYLHAQQQSATEVGYKGKASAEDQTGPLRARFEHPYSIGSYMPPQVPGIEVTMSEGRHHPTPSWARQDGFETGGTPYILDGGNGSLKNFRDENEDENAVAVAIAEEEEEDQGEVGDAQTQGALNTAITTTINTTVKGGVVSRHYNSDASASASAKKDGELERTLSPLDSSSSTSADLNKPKVDQLQSPASPLPGSFSLVKPEGPNKQGSSSPSPTQAGLFDELNRKTFPVCSATVPPLRRASG
ncbi:uncharacterized protein DFL_005573 [Arthrobotrys flagrans]|uniref:Uncharacterized protein n=1 Tax=Arthrobotrys flagrans TaxID=97331 RepID=A0A436ZXS6_ARTFL|nr:hypothetical protein DFL_005573 [Arthrobotrys flagrans]